LRTRLLLGVILGVTASAVAEPVWTSGMGLRLEYRELAGTLASAGADDHLVIRSDGNEYALVLSVPTAESKLLKPKATVILKGFVGTAVLPGQPPERLVWPLEATVRLTKMTFADPTSLWQRWLRGYLGLPDAEPFVARDD